MTAKTFTVSRDSTYDFIVHERSRAQSYAMVPADFDFNFITRAGAHLQVDRLNRLEREHPGSVRTRAIETPDRFEAVADTKCR
jgi:hypothetical protein